VAASELDHPEPLEAVTASEVLNALGFAGWVERPWET
jgi:hypothetical protein